ncbi:hypothetical protein MP638_004942 [Amoeboaphelidium occidentale]|nr:hypothetical protein MP638_004942 [Amoeboaphelidium occidentale]
MPKSVQHQLKLTKNLKFYEADKLKSKSKSKSSKTPTSAKKYEQMYLKPSSTFHQSTPSTCQTCKMEYIKGLEEDEKVHLKFHDFIVNGIQLKLNQKSSKDGNIYKFKWSDLSASQKMKINEVLFIVNKELGSASELSKSAQESCVFFVYLSEDSKVLGVLIAEPITSGYKAIHRSKTENDSVGLKENVEMDHQNPVKCLCGISRIWVHSHHRNKRIGSMLLESCCNNFIYGMILSPSDLAFTQPTDSGAKLASSFCKGSFNVYVEK